MSNQVYYKPRHILMCDFDAVSHISNRKIKLNSKEFRSPIFPEIWKKRPVIVLLTHKKLKIATVIPLTSQPPTEPSFAVNTVEIPKSMLCGGLGKKSSWAICDMLMSVSFDRLSPVYSGIKNKPFISLTDPASFLSQTYFDQIKITMNKLVNAMG